MKGWKTTLNDSIIVLDTNILSDVFESSPDYYNFIINCLDKVKDNIWLTDTILHELSSIKNKPYTAPSFEESKLRFLEIVRSNIDKEVRAVEKFKKYRDVLKEVKILDELINEIHNKENKLKDMLDRIGLSKLVEPAMLNVKRNYVKELIDNVQRYGRISEPLQRSILEKVSYQVERNANNGRPFPDKNKKGIAKYNDFFIVQELKMLAKTQKRKILFVTSDVKGNFQDERLEQDFKSETGYEISIKSGNDFYIDIANQFKIFQENITESFIYEEQFDFLEALNDNSNLRIIIEYFLLISDIDGEEEELNYLGIHLDDIEIDSFNDDEVSYIVTGYIDAEKVFYECWGRDDDTKNVITSPPNHKFYSGKIELFVNREFDVEDDGVITRKVDFEIMDTSELEDEVRTWGEYDI